jgi:abortive infection Abi-like protein
MAEPDFEQQAAAAPDELNRCLREISMAADEVVERDATTREQLKVLANRLVDEARRAHVYASGKNFALVEDSYGDGRGVYGYLSVGPHGFHLATRTEWDDIAEQSLDPEGDPLFSVQELENWPVEWLRLIVQSNLMSDLAQSLLTTMRKRLSDPNKAAVLPSEMQQPVPNVVSVAAGLKFSKVVDVWREAQRELATNPTGALRTACVLLETVCRHVLHERQSEVPSTLTLPNLYKAAEKELHMDEDERKIATGLRAAVDGIAHGRSHLSNAHGAGPQDQPPTASHAELAVTASGALAVHLMKVLARTPKDTGHP